MNKQNNKGIQLHNEKKRTFNVIQYLKEPQIIIMGAFH